MSSDNAPTLFEVPEDVRDSLLVQETAVRRGRAARLLGKLKVHCVTLSRCFTWLDSFIVNIGQPRNRDKDLAKTS